MPKRRGNKEGSIYQDKDGTWFAQMPPDEFGKRRKARAKTQKEARELLKKMQQEQKSGLDVSTNYTIQEFQEVWFSEVVGRSAKPTTLSSYRWIFSKYILPSLGKVKVNALKPAQVQSFINQMDDKGYAPETTRNAYRRLRSMMETAVLWRLASFNPCNGVRLPRNKEQSGSVLNVQQGVRLLYLMRDERFELVYWLGALLLLRRGELCGLRWEDVDWEQRTIKVVQQVAMVNNRPVIQSTKNDTERTLPLTDRLIEGLKKRYGEMEEERQFMAERWQENGLIFPSTIGTPLSPRNLSRHLESIRGDELKEATLHSLRRTGATLMAELEVLPYVIREILGHISTGNVTERYTRANLTSMRLAVEKLERHIMQFIELLP